MKKAEKTEEPLYLNPKKPMEARIKDLILRMTLEEKVSQMVNKSRAIARLGIPEYDWWNECLHGVARAGRATVFPQAIGLASTFDTELMYRVASAIGDEARAKHHAAARHGNRGRYRGLTFWAPNINIFRDPRWGRGQETFGEDPFLTGAMGSAFVKGLQGNHPRYIKAAAAAKHFAVHSGPEKERHHFNAVTNLRDLNATYLPAFKALVDVGVEAVMTAYTRTNGEPCCASPTLLGEILRNQWGFKGHVISDCGAIEDLHEHHGYTKTAVESAAAALNSGCDLNCGCVYEHLVEAVRQGLVKEETIDRSLANLLRTKFKLGLFDPPAMNPYVRISPKVVNCAKHRALAREAAAKSIVLLKNRNNLLPLDKGIKSVYVLGANASNTDILLGNYYGLSGRMVTILEGLAAKVDEGTTVGYKHGCLLAHDNPNPLEWSIPEAKFSDAVVAVMGLWPNMEGEEGDAIESAECGDRSDIRLPAHQVRYLTELSHTGTPVILVLAGGSPVAIPELHELADAILWIWYPGEEGGTAVADALFGDVVPSGRLPVTFPRSPDQLPPFTEYSMAGRTYRYMKDAPLYPFGYGLSYTRFCYSPLRLSPASVKAGRTVEAEVTVTNAGTYAADEVVQLYVSALEASAPAPVCELKAFRRIRLQPGQGRCVKFVVTSAMMELVDDRGERKLEPGRFRVTVGGCSPGVRSEELGAALGSAEFVVRG